MYDNLHSLRATFPALSQQVYGKPLVYLDNAATAQKPLPVLDVLREMEAGLNGNIHRAVHFLSAACTRKHEEARAAVAAFLGGADPAEVVFTSGTTAAINLVAWSFGEAFVHAGDKIVVTVAEHHSNLVPWQLLCRRKGAVLEVIDVQEDGRLDLTDVDQKLQNARLLALAQVSNVLGLVNPVEELIQRAHARGVAVLVDGAQGVMHSPLNVKTSDVDFYVFSGHKLYGPTGTGVLYGKKAYLEQLPPWQGGGDMIHSVSLTRGTTFAPPPLKFEAGTPNFIGIAGLGAALDFLGQIDPAFRRAHEEALTAQGLEQLQRIPGLKLLGAGTGPEGRIPLFSFTLEGAHPNDLALLLDQAGIALRSGQLCAEPLLTRYGLTAVLRASFGLYNTLDELAYFTDRLQWAARLLQ